MKYGEDRAVSRSPQGPSRQGKGGGLRKRKGDRGGEARRRGCAVSRSPRTPPDKEKEGELQEAPLVQSIAPTARSNMCFSSSVNGCTARASARGAMCAGDCANASRALALRHRAINAHVELIVGRRNRRRARKQSGRQSQFGLHHLGSLPCCGRRHEHHAAYVAAAGGSGCVKPHRSNAVAPEVRHDH